MPSGKNMFDLLTKIVILHALFAANILLVVLYALLVVVKLWKRHYFQERKRSSNIETLMVKAEGNVDQAQQLVDKTVPKSKSY